MRFPYQGVMRDDRNKEMERIDSHQDFDDVMRDMDAGINAEPTEGPRDGVTKVKRMHPDRYIPNGGCK